MYTPDTYGDGRRVLTEKTGPAHNRNIALAATTHPGTDATNTATWTAAEAVTELTIDAIPTTAGAVQANDKYLVVVNAPSAAVAKAWLEDAGTASQDVLYEVGSLQSQKVISRSAPITRVDVLPIGDTMRVIIGAV